MAQAKLHLDIAVPFWDLDTLMQQATHRGWRRWFLCFQSSRLERDFLSYYAGDCSHCSCSRLHLALRMACMPLCIDSILCRGLPSIPVKVLAL